MLNTDIKEILKQKNIRHWKLADLLGVSEATLVRKLRHELTKEEKEEILNIIKNYKVEEVKECVKR